MTLNGGNGNDLLTGGDGADQLNGDADNDTLVGFRGNDVMNGGPGDDRLIWNNGDGSDVMNGDDGTDVVEVNGAAAGDAFEIAPDGSRVDFERTNLGPFTLDISAEALEVNSGDGDDTISVISLPETRIDIDGGAPSASDSLTVDAQEQIVTQTPDTLLVQGRQPITFVNIEELTLLNAHHALYLPIIFKEANY